MNICINPSDSYNNENRFEDSQSNNDHNTFSNLRRESVKDVMLLEWRNLTCNYSHNGKEIIILSNISGYANPGELTAIMGPSGCGKTTLLNKLAKRDLSKDCMNTSGMITVNSIDINEFDYHSYVGYVTQDDILFETFTPNEALLFTAYLKLSSNTKHNLQRTQALIQSLHLFQVQDTMIGSALHKKLSGGERKRVSIGIQLISNPYILFLDEPTSGLDSLTADTIIDVLISEAVCGKTIVATIHQPSYRSYLKFDKLILMCDGNIVFHAPPSEAKKYFAKIDFRVPRHINPPDHFMALLHIRDKFNKSQEDLHKLQAVNNLFQSNQDLVSSLRCKK